MKKRGIWTYLLSLSLLIPATSFAKRRALVIGIDGLKGSELHHVAWETNQAPAIRGLMSRGIFAPCASFNDSSCARAHDGIRSLLTQFKFYNWVTAPGWGSVISGVNSFRHKVKGNDFDTQKNYCSTSQTYPSIMKRLKDHGYQTSAGGVANFLTSFNDGTNSSISGMGIADMECGCDVVNKASQVSPSDASTCNLNYRRALYSNDEERDEKLLAWMLEMIDNDEVDMIMGVLDQVDEAGHRNGFSRNSAYDNAIIKADHQVQKLVQALEKRVEKMDEEWMVLITSDHGGHVNIKGTGSHNFIINQDDAVPFVEAVIGLRSLPLSPLKNPVRQMDVHPTLGKWFGLPASDVDGVAQGLENLKF